MFAFRRYRHVALILLSLTSILAFAEPQFVRFDAEVCHRPQDVKVWGISEEQLNVLCQASHFSITLLRRDSQFIVLVGENHKTTFQGHEEAKAILPHFPFRGIEGVSDTILDRVTPISDVPVQEYQYTSLIYLSRSQGLAIDTYSMPRFDGLNGLSNDSRVDNKKYSKFMLEINAPQPSSNWGNLKFFKKRVYPYFRKAHPTTSLSINLEPDNELFDTRTRDRALAMCKKNIPCADAMVVDYRNFIMRETANDAVQNFPEEKVLLMVVGQAHVAGLVHSFVCEDGYKHHTLSRRGMFVHEKYLYLARLQFMQDANSVPPARTESFEFFPYNCQND